jgi:hypothetical protein
MGNNVGTGGAAIGLWTGADIVAEDTRDTLAAILAFEAGVEAVEGSLTTFSRVAGWTVALVAALGTGLVDTSAAHTGVLGATYIALLTVLAFKWVS